MQLSSSRRPCWSRGRQLEQAAGVSAALPFLLLPAFAALILWPNSATANPYDKCILEHAAPIKELSSDGIDAIVEACVKTTEGLLDADEAAKVRIGFLTGK